MAGLIEVPGNPVPRGAVCDIVRTDDGVDLRFARWPPNRGVIRGTVLLVHGRTEYIEKYFETVADLRRRGFAVATFDARGQGGSGRLLGDARKGHVRDFADYVNDLETVMQEVVLPDCPPPYYVLAHSMGGTVALLAAERIRTQVERMVITAPLAGLPRAGAKRLAQLTGFMMYFGVGEAFLPGRGATLLETLPFEGNPVTSDPNRYARAHAVIEASPALGVGGPTIGWINAAMRAATYMEDPEFAARVPIPTLIVLAGAESLVSNRAAEALARRLKTAAHLQIPGARHEILMERDEYRDQFWAAFDAFIQGRR